MEFTPFDSEMMEQSIAIAKSSSFSEVPVGALIVKNGKIIAKASNSYREGNTVHEHAEINAINDALTFTKGEKLNDCTLYVTLEPCLMCTGAIIHSRLGRVVIGALDPKGGAMVSSLTIAKIPNLNHYPHVTSGVLKDKASELLKNYFKQKRE